MAQLLGMIDMNAQNIETGDQNHPVRGSGLFKLHSCLVYYPYRLIVWFVYVCMCVCLCLCLCMCVCVCVYVCVCVCVWETHFSYIRFPIVIFF